jgi:hypothetical protein
MSTQKNRSHHPNASRSNPVAASPPTLPATPSLPLRLPGVRRARRRLPRALACLPRLSRVASPARTHPLTLIGAWFSASPCKIVDVSGRFLLLSFVDFPRHC